MNIDLSALLSAIGNQSSAIGTTASSVADLGRSQVAVRDEISSKLTQSAELTALETSTSGLGELRAQQNARKAAAALGSDMDMSNEIITALGIRVRDSSLRALDSLDRIKQKESVGFFDNPLEFISNQLTSGQDYETYNLAVEEHNQAASALQNINTATTSSAQAQLAISERVTEASIAARAERARLAASMLVDENKVRSFAEQQDNLLRVTQLQGQQLQTHLQARQLYNEERNFEMRRQEFAASMSARSKEKLDAEQDQEAITNAINITRKQIGLQELRSGEVTRMFKLGGSIAEDLRTQALAGMSAIATGTPKIAANPSEAILFLNRNKGKLSSPVLNSFLGNLPTETSRALTPAEYTKLNPQAKAEAIDNYARARLAGYAAEIKPEDGTNIYRPLPASALLKAAGLQNSSLAALINPILAERQDKDISPAQIIDLSARAARMKQVRPEKIAAELDTYFAVAKDLNNLSNNYEQIGLSPQQQINVKVGGKVVDVSNPSVLRLQLMRSDIFSNRTSFEVLKSRAPINAQTPASTFDVTKEKLDKMKAAGIVRTHEVAKDLSYSSNPIANPSQFKGLTAKEILASVPKPYITPEEVKSMSDEELFGFTPSWR